MASWQRGYWCTSSKCHHTSVLCRRAHTLLYLPHIYWKATQSVHARVFCVISSLARYFDSQASAFVRWPSRPPPRFLGRCHNSDRNFNRLKMRLELHDCLQINTHCDVTLILPPTFKRMHYMRLKLDTRLTNSL